jgi:hypothetical protein
MIWRYCPKVALLTLIGFLVMGAGAALAWDAGAQSREARTARAFQLLVGGLGLGPAADLSGCALAFDRRLADGCSQDGGPLPLGSEYCPLHSL